LFVISATLHFTVKFCLGVLPLVLYSNIFTSNGSIRFARSTQTQELKTAAPSTLGIVNNLQVNNKSQQIVLLPENSTELNSNFVLKEQYELQNETGFSRNIFLNCTYLHLCNFINIFLFTDVIDRSNDTYTNITSLPELSNYMTTHFVLISGASLAACVIILSFGTYSF